MIHSFKPAELTDHTEDPKTQAVLFSSAFDTMRSIIDSPLLKAETKHALVTTLANYFLDVYVRKTPGATPPGTMIDLEDIEKAMGAAPTPIAKPVEPSDSQVEEFDSLMKDVIGKNKGRKMSKSLLGKANIEKLVTLIDSYKGSVKVLQKIRGQINRSGKETSEEKAVILSDFVRTLI